MWRAARLDVAEPERLTSECREKVAQTSRLDVFENPAAVLMVNGILPVLIVTSIVFLVGVMIGSIGIGGVLLVPTLTYLTGTEIHVAISACMLSYAFSGTVGAIIYARRGTIHWRAGLWLSAGATPGAYLGALTASVLPARTITLVVALVVVVAAVNALRKPGDIAQGSPSQSRTVLSVFGAVVGFGSALSGTGGPLLLVPLLVWCNWPVLTAVGLSQIIQVPISLLATLSNYLHGEIALTLGIGIAVVMMAGVAIGARLAHRVPSLLLRRSVAVVFSVVGICMLWQAF